MKDNKKDNGFKISIAIICVLSVITAACCGYLATNKLRTDVGTGLKDAFTFNFNESSTDESEPTDTPVDLETARLMFAGENLLYNTIYNEAKEKSTDGTYNFSHIYSGIKEILGEADLAMVNQSTVISDSIAVSSAPNFCSPTAFADALCDAGFNAVNLAGKHIWDKGESGAKDTLKYWKAKSGVFTTGLYENEEDMTAVQVKKVNGIDFAFVTFSYSLNGWGYSSQSGARLLLADESGKSQVDFYNQIKDIIRSANDKADVTVVCVDFDQSGERAADSNQQSVINYLVSFGADVIIGTGTGSLQPMEIRDNGNGSKTVIAYSLGSFLSGSSEKESMVSAVADIVYSKDEESGEVTLEGARLIPTVTMIESGNKNYHIIPYSELDEAEAASHPVSGFNAEFTEDYFEEVIASQYLEKHLMDTEDLLGTAKTEAEDSSDNSTENTEAQ